MSDEIRDLFHGVRPSISVPPRDLRRVVGEGRRRLRRRRLLSSAAAVAALAVAGAGINEVVGRRGLSPVASGERLRVVATVPLHAPYDLTPDFPRDLAYGFGYVWVLHARDGTLQRIDPATNRVDRVIDLRGETRDPSSLWDVEAGAGRLWVTNPSAGQVLAVDPASGRVDGRVRGLSHPLGTYFLGGALWVIAGGGDDDESLYRVDPATLEVTGSLRTGTECCLSGIVELDGDLWVSYSDVPSRPRNDAPDVEDRVFDLSLQLRRIDPRAVAFVETIPLAGDTYRPGDTVLGGLTTAEGHLWVARPEAGAVDRVDPVTGRVDSIDVSASLRPGTLTYYGGRMWVWDLGGSGAAPIDPVSLEVGPESDLTVAGGGHPIEGAGALWVPSGSDGDQHDSISRIEAVAPGRPPVETPEASAAPPETAPAPAADPVVEEMTEREQAEVFAFRALAATGLMDPFSERSYNFTYADDTTREDGGWRIGFAASDCEPRRRGEGHVFTCRGLSGEDPELGNALTDTYVTVARDGRRWRVVDVTGNMLPDEKRRLIGYALPEHRGPSHWEFPAAGAWPARDGVVIEMVALWIGPYPTRAPGSVCEVHLIAEDGVRMGEPRRFYQQPPDRAFEHAGWVKGVESLDEDADDVVVECRQSGD